MVSTKIVVSRAGDFIGRRLVADLSRQGAQVSGVKGSCKTLVRSILTWEASTRLRHGLERTDHWICDEMVLRRSKPTPVAIAS
jgi:hypothetical protein